MVVPATANSRSIVIEPALNPTCKEEAALKGFTDEVALVDVDVVVVGLVVTPKEELESAGGIESELVDKDEVLVVVVLIV